MPDKRVFLKNSLTPAKAHQEVYKRLNAKATEELKNLLEQKHLYQSVSIDPSAFVAEIGDGVGPTESAKHDFMIWGGRDLVKEQFAFNLHLVPIPRDSSLPLPQLRITLPHASLYCRVCKRRETFTPVWFTDASNELLANTLAGVKKVTPPDGFQLFFLVYQCQRCIGTPEASARVNEFETSVHRI